LLRDDLCELAGTRNGSRWSAALGRLIQAHTRQPLWVVTSKAAPGRSGSLLVTAAMTDSGVATRLVSEMLRR
jgi:hypothetical protein